MLLIVILLIIVYGVIVEVCLIDLSRCLFFVAYVSFEIMFICWCLLCLKVIFIVRILIFLNSHFMFCMILGLFIGTVGVWCYYLTLNQLLIYRQRFIILGCYLTLSINYFVVITYFSYPSIVYSPLILSLN